MILTVVVEIALMVAVDASSQQRLALMAGAPVATGLIAFLVMHR
jgi:hypothetical protein